mmetsp:Transcript_88605/g.264269  ORF Transcript_88605/g.264269 Transcript_88605/m.264269 type:complete len:211 (+) Transcript_88605:194-826(+)
MARDILDAAQGAKHELRPREALGRCGRWRRHGSSGGRAQRDRRPQPGRRGTPQASGAVRDSDRHDGPRADRHRRCGVHRGAALLDDQRQQVRLLHLDGAAVVGPTVVAVLRPQSAELQIGGPLRLRDGELAEARHTVALPPALAAALTERAVGAGAVRARPAVAPSDVVGRSHRALPRPRVQVRRGAKQPVAGTDAHGQRELRCAPRPPA